MPTKPSTTPVVDFDAKHKATKPKVRAKIKAFGKEWRLVRPNQMIAGRLIDHSGDLNTAYLNDYLLAHVYPDDREAFTVAALSAETLDIEALMELMQMMTEVVYEQIPSAPS
jgi:hypothetical protein